MGFTALMAAAFHTFNYRQGLDAVFFWAVLQIPSQTPFTTCEGRDTSHAFVVTLATLGLFYIAFLHFDVRGEAQGEPVEDEDAPVTAQMLPGDDPEKMKEAKVEDVEVPPVDIVPEHKAGEEEDGQK